MFRIWRARLMTTTGQWDSTHPTWIIMQAGGPVADSDVVAWQEYLNVMRRKLKHSTQFVDNEFLKENFPNGWEIDLEIVEFNGYGVARI